jgi:hypothetical protein
MDDDFDENIFLQTTPVEVGFIDFSQAPVPGNSGIITTTGRTETTVQLIWAPASDDTTPQSELHYKVVVSRENNIGSVSGAESNGTVVMDWIADTVSAVAGDLTESTTYFFTVLVMDSDGKVSAYTVVSAATRGDTVFLFSAGTRTGNMAPIFTDSVRNDVDDICKVAKTGSYPTLPCLNVRAFISVSSGDSIAGMPENFDIPTDSEIKGPSGVQVAPHWDVLLACEDGDEDSCLDTRLEDAGIIDSFWWSGSQSDGTYYSDGSSSDPLDSARNCNSWTDGTNEYQGRVGAHNRADAQWINSTDRNCDNSLHLLCICW